MTNKAGIEAWARTIEDAVIETMAKIKSDNATQLAELKRETERARRIGSELQAQLSKTKRAKTGTKK